MKRTDEGGMYVLKTWSVKSVTILILITCFVCLITAYKLAFTTQRLPKSQVTLQTTA